MESWSCAVRNQHEDGEGARPPYPSHVACPRRRGDRVDPTSVHAAHRLTSAVGTDCAYGLDIAQMNAGIPPREVRTHEIATIRIRSWLYGSRAVPIDPTGARSDPCNRALPAPCRHRIG